MGLHTGPVAGGNLAYAPQRLYTAVENTIHHATQLQRLAISGTILMSAATHRLVQAEVLVDASTAPVIDGQRVPVPVYMLRSLTQRRTGVPGQAARRRSRFVGRAREM